MGLLVRILRKIIHNDSMKTDPDEIYNWRVFALVFASCFGGMLFGWDTGAISGVLAMEETKIRFGYDKWEDSRRINMEQNIVSTLQAGCLAGCIITGYCADRFGRRLCLIACGILTTIGVVFQAASAAHGTIAVMYVGRFIAGVGVGAASTLVPLYVSECAPRAIRGALTCKLKRWDLGWHEPDSVWVSDSVANGLLYAAFYQLFIVTGIMISFW